MGNTTNGHFNNGPGDNNNDGGNRGNFNGNQVRDNGTLDGTSNGGDGGEGSNFWKNVRRGALGLCIGVAGLSAFWIWCPTGFIAGVVGALGLASCGTGVPVATLSLSANGCRWESLFMKCATEFHSNEMFFT